MTDDRTNGDLIAQWREKRGLTQEQLAVLVGVTRSAVNLWENGHNGITEPKLRQLVAALNLTMSQFYRGPSPAKPEQAAG